MEKLVTKPLIKKWVEGNPELVIGRALVAIFKYQTVDERNNNGTKYLNGVGFSANDGRIGSLGAKYFLKYGTLLEWQLKPWLKSDKNGFPRIAKYHEQLNRIAHEKANTKTIEQISYRH